MVQTENDTAYLLKFFKGDPFNENNIRSFFSYIISLGYKLNNSEANLYTLSERFSVVEFIHADDKIIIRKTEQTGWHVLNCSFETGIPKTKIIEILMSASRQLFAEFASSHDIKISDSKDLDAYKNIQPDFLWLSSNANINQFTPWLANKSSAKQWDGSLLLYPNDTVTDQQKTSSAKQEIPASAIFNGLDTIRKAEVLRWFLHDYKVANERIIETLATALTDKNWEVCVTAMLVSVRLKVPMLLPKIKTMDLPTTSRSGLDSKERSALVGMKHAAIALLGGEQVPQSSPGSLQNKDEKWTHLLQCVSGEHVQLFDKVFLLSLALSNITTDYIIPDHPIINSFTIAGNKFFLPVSGIEMIFIPAGKFWLGNDGEPVEENIRNVSNDKGFFISRYSVFAETMKDEITEEENGPLYFKDDSYKQCSFEDAKKYCADLSNREGMKIDLPYVTEWEMTARGKNGSLYPWGCCYFDNMLIEPSAFNAMAMVGIVAQWAINEINNVQCLVGGKSGKLRCYEKETPINSQSSGAVRIIVRL